MSAIEQPSAGWRAHVAVAGIAGAVLGVELSVTRFIGWLLPYDAALMVLAVAVAGCGVGAALVAVVPRLMTTSAVPFLAAAMGACSLAGLGGCFAALPTLLVDGSVLFGLVFLPAFACGGAAVTILIVQAGPRASTVYAADLAGAAAAALLCGPVLDVDGPVAAVAVWGATAVAASLACAPHLRRALPPVVACVALCGVVVVPAVRRGVEGAAIARALPPLAAAIQAKVPVAARPLWIRRAFLGEHGSIADTVWSSAGRTDVFMDDKNPDVAGLWFDAGVPAPVFRWDGDERFMPARAASLPGVLPYGVRPIRSVLSLGSGGGLDVLAARTHGATRIDAVDLNPGIPTLLARPALRDFHGDIYAAPRVSFTVEDARSFAARAPKNTYDLVVLSLTETLAAQLGAALPESYVQTSEACATYLSLLDDRGMLLFVSEDPSNIYGLRWLLTCMPALTALTHESEDAGLAHVLFARARVRVGSYGSVMLLSRSPWSDDEIAKLKSEAERLGLDVTLVKPNAEHQNTLAEVAAASAAGAPGKEPARIDAVDDDRPYFFDTSTTLDAEWWTTLLGTAIFGALALVALFTMLRRDDRAHAVTIAPALLAAAVAGASFMVVEVISVQRLLLLVGTATQTMATTVFGLLLGASLTSAATRNFVDPRRAGAALALAAALGVGGAAHVPARFLSALLATPHEAHVVVATAWALALGACVGGAFPQILRALERTGGPRAVAAGWAINAAFALCGSVGAVMLARSRGLTTGLEVAAAGYALVAAVMAVAAAGRERGLAAGGAGR